MHFDIIGPFNMSLTPGGLVASSAAARKAFWIAADATCPGVSAAHGCYVFAMCAPNGTVPWYVGKAERNSFAGECFQAHKIVHYNNSFNGKKYIPQLFLIPKYTPGGNFAGTSKNIQHDIDFLEKFLIGIALNRNPDLQNIANTAFLRNMAVPGILNSTKGKPTAAVKALKSVLGQ